jgi:hypothetical protein
MVQKDSYWKPANGSPLLHRVELFNKMKRSRRKSSQKNSRRDCSIRISGAVEKPLPGSIKSIAFYEYSRRYCIPCLAAFSITRREVRRNEQSLVPAERSHVSGH